MSAALFCNVIQGLAISQLLKIEGYYYKKIDLGNSRKGKKKQESSWGIKDLLEVVHFQQLFDT